MQNENKKSKTWIAVVAFVVMVSGYFVFTDNISRNSEQQNDTDRTVERTKAENEFIGSELVVVADRVDNAGRTIARGEQLVGEIQTRITTHRVGIKRCQQLVEDCIVIVKENRELICGTGKTNPD